MLKNIGNYLKKLNNDLKKLHKYQDNIAYGLDYLFNELSEEDINQKKKRVLLMVVICYMKLEGIKIIN